ncbi:hypothetical protein [Rhizobium sp. Root651]|uniref:hypothetical protein n=1 Tax=Rhizobium sp. Root651 TaxID=1736577 RepID=UPI0007150C13|nr:hypothetical protein [Rhizobium sp. Root651]KRA58167.1 hypothetical protein ASD85_16940 [Rhizobium sp. Root651]
MGDITDLIEQQMKTADRHFNVLLKLAVSNRSAIRDIISALDNVSGADKKVLSDALADLEKADEEVIDMAKSIAT